MAFYYKVKRKDGWHVEYSHPNGDDLIKICKTSKEATELLTVLNGEKKVKEMKYYIGEIHERNGDLEYDTKYLFATDGDPDDHTEKVAMEWRGGDENDYDEQEEAYWSDCSLIYDYGSKEIPQEDFEVLKKYLSVL